MFGDVRFKEAWGCRKKQRGRFHSFVVLKFQPTVHRPSQFVFGVAARPSRAATELAKEGPPVFPAMSVLSGQAHQPRQQRGQ